MGKNCKVIATYFGPRRYFPRDVKDTINIMVSRVHERNDKHTCVAEYRTLLPNLEKLTEEMICIPCGWWVTDEDREYIVECIKKGW